MKNINCPVEDLTEITSLNAGEWITLSGTIYIMRDKTHYRLFEENVPIPVTIRNSAVLHAAPSYREENGEYRIITVGPTTSIRMEKYTPPLLEEYGPKLIIGKGGMGGSTRETLKKTGSVYLEYVGGTAALLLTQIVKVTGVWWIDLYGEALWEIQVKDMGPMVVGIDSSGRDLFEEVRKEALAKLDRPHEDGSR